MKRTTILLADDHKIVAEGLKSILEPEFDLVAIVENGRALLTAADTLRPDVIIADISMPLLNGIEAVRQIKKKDENIMVVFLTMHPDVTYAASAFDAGASGYVLKHSAPSELITAIHSVLAGKTYITPLLAGDLMLFYKERRHEQCNPATRLTARQKEVIQLHAEGRTTKEIASLLNISPRTVEFHKYRLMQEFGLKNSAELIHFALKHKIISI
jgi:DNA-binding NarL/FixJ family response regulator